LHITHSGLSRSTWARMRWSRRPLMRSVMSLVHHATQRPGGGGAIAGGGWWQLFRSLLVEPAFTFTGSVALPCLDSLPGLTGKDCRVRAAGRR